LDEAGTYLVKNHGCCDPINIVESRTAAAGIVAMGLGWKNNFGRGKAVRYIYQWEIEGAMDQ